jgi:hypothetical protein
MTKMFNHIFLADRPWPLEHILNVKANLRLVILRGLSPQRAGFDPKPVHRAFVIDKVARRQVCSRHCDIPMPAIIPHTHTHTHTRAHTNMHTNYKHTKHTHTDTNTHTHTNHKHTKHTHTDTNTHTHTHTHTHTWSWLNRHMTTASADITTYQGFPVDCRTLGMTCSAICAKPKE